MKFTKLTIRRSPTAAEENERGSDADIVVREVADVEVVGDVSGSNVYVATKDRVEVARISYWDDAAVCIEDAGVTIEGRLLGVDNQDPKFGSHSYGRWLLEVSKA